MPTTWRIVPSILSVRDTTTIANANILMGRKILPPPNAPVKLLPHAHKGGQTYGN